jgi:NAD(P)-dependent dehydrogenase (short-subunit alcohol dehydrogenase family)
VARIRRDGGAVVVLDALAGPGVDHVGDVTDAAFVESAVASTVEQLGSLDLVANLAGISGPTCSALEIELEEFRRVVDVNLFGTFLVARTAARAMVAAGTGGTIVNISSMVAQQAVRGLVSYAASKGGVALLTQTLALDLAEHRITANTIAPGHIMSDLHMGYVERVSRIHGTSVEQELQGIRDSIPLGRHGTGDDIAAAIMWLASPDGAYVTGQTIAVNGGVWLS